MTLLAVITGASGGIGRAIASRLSTIADHLILAARRREPLQTMTLPGPATVDRISVDVTKAEDITLLSDAVQRLSPARIVLINAAGTFGPVGGIENTKVEDWLQTLKVHVLGALATIQECVPLMIKADWGRVINISSAQTLHGPDSAAGAYATAKMAQNVLTSGAAMQFADTDISFCSIHPGDVGTQMAADIRRKAHDAGGIADHLYRWATNIQAGAGDHPAAAGELVVRIIENPASWSNGRFLLVPSSIGRHPDQAWSMPIGPSPENLIRGNSR